MTASKDLSLSDNALGCYSQKAIPTREMVKLHIYAPPKNEDEEFLPNLATSMGNAPKWVDEKCLGGPFNSTGMRFPPYSSHIQLGALQHA